MTRLTVVPDLAHTWRDYAACAGHSATNYDTFFGRDTGNNRYDREAKAICAGCPVTDECLAYAVANDLNHGVYGGLNAKERSKLRRGGQVGPFDGHGTHRGYDWHRRRFEPPCDPCRAAKQDYDRARYELRKQADR